MDTKSSKRDDILAATLRLTVENGFPATSASVIAETANVGMGTIYRYFDSKDALFSVLFDELTNQFMNVIVTNYDGKLDPYTNFKNINIVLVKYYTEHVYEFRYLERYSESSLKFDKKLDELTKLIEPISKMAQGINHGIKFKQLPPLVLFAMTYGPLVALVNLVHMNKIELNDELIEEIADSCWKSILEE